MSSILDELEEKGIIEFEAGAVNEEDYDCDVPFEEIRFGAWMFFDHKIAVTTLDDPIDTYAPAKITFGQLRAAGAIELVAESERNTPDSFELDDDDWSPEVHSKIQNMTEDYIDVELRQRNDLRHAVEQYERRQWNRRH